MKEKCTQKGLVKSALIQNFPKRGNSEEHTLAHVWRCTVTYKVFRLMWRESRRKEYHFKIREYHFVGLSRVSFLKNLKSENIILSVYIKSTILKFWLYYMVLCFEMNTAITTEHVHLQICLTIHTTPNTQTLITLYTTMVLNYLLILC